MPTLLWFILCLNRTDMNVLKLPTSIKHEEWAQGHEGATLGAEIKGAAKGADLGKVVSIHLLSVETTNAKYKRRLTSHRGQQRQN